MLREVCSDAHGERTWRANGCPVAAHLTLGAHLALAAHLTLGAHLALAAHLVLAASTQRQMSLESSSLCKSPRS